MIYTKEQAIEQTYLRINGGKLTQQTTTKREDIELYLMAATAYMFGVDIKERLQQALINKRLGGSMTVNYDDLKTTEYFTPQFDQRKKEHYLELGASIGSVGGVQFWEVSPLQGFGVINKVSSRKDLIGLDSVIGIVAYYLQNPKPRIYLINMPDKCEVELTRTINFSAIKDTDPLPVPDDKQKLVIDLTVEFMTGQKIMKDDKIIDNLDNKGK